jgi:hypothetical protein
MRVYLPSTLNDTALVEPGKNVEVSLVNRSKECPFQPIKPEQRDGLRDPKPKNLNYEVDWGCSMLREDMKDLFLVHRIGKGTVAIEWKDEELPSDVTSGVVKAEKGDSPPQPANENPKPNR